MPRYIDADALKQFIQENGFVYANTLDTFPTADVESVVHGRWLNFVGDFSTAECSKCGEVYEVSPDATPCEDYFNAFKQFYKYCPSCGALMDGKDGEK
jgi:Zn finger protein HypA/HybF involved in hydrogenase expression